MAHDYRLLDTDNFKSVRSLKYNYTFDKRTGLFLRWGESLGDDPEFSPFGPEIADIEISTGDCSGGCPWCYKSNGDGFGEHMSDETFKSVLDALPDTITQIALGITDADANPYFVDILKACVERGTPHYASRRRSDARMVRQGGGNIEAYRNALFSRGDQLLLPRSDVLPPPGGGGRFR